ncbi:hypothetical protein VIC_001037 [Vibrio coralliilyticus ATCC BAA-450]|nr:hypothetical protein VIC_001037 [Vibrio coralliilyticus ATCC BAA-450]
MIIRHHIHPFLRAMWASDQHFVLKQMALDGVLKKTGNDFF